jgi:hypothetical protein
LKEHVICKEPKTLKEAYEKAKIKATASTCGEDTNLKKKMSEILKKLDNKQTKPEEQPEISYIEQNTHRTTQDERGRNQPNDSLNSYYRNSPPWKPKEGYYSDSSAQNRNEN